ncbi:MAG: AraC family transcriptional regulator [Caulobacteraceae bacterium]|nr:AraC family transcriptional regulator [Caulobacteraceae bacterium]
MSSQETEAADLFLAGPARLRAIKRDIAANLSDQALSIGAVALRHGLGVRRLQRLFETRGESFTVYLLGLRLAEVRRALTDPRGRNRAIGAIALDAGFGDISHFNHAFRGRYRATPSQVREAACGHDSLLSPLAGRGGAKTGLRHPPRPRPDHQ